MRGTHPCWIVAVALSSPFPASAALAEAGAQVAPDGVIVISKDVGEERWSIVYDAERGTAVGNVFFPGGGDPQFVWCEKLSQADGNVRLRCLGSDRCEAGPCGGSDWSLIAEVDLPTTFLQPPPVGPPNVRDALGNCEGRAPDPGPFPNQLSPGMTLHRLTLEAPDALCNDGTQAVLYVRAASEAAHQTDWVLHTQGGGSCTTYEQCEERWCGADFYDASKMSSSWAPPAVLGRGIHTTDARNSFAGWNHVYFYYCTSDSWTGRGPAELVNEEGTQRYSLHRNGHRILERAFEVLREGVRSDDGDETLSSISGATRILWTGTSAGSNGAQANSDWVSEQFPNAEVRAVFDAASSPRFGTEPQPVQNGILQFGREKWETRIAQEAVRPFLDASCDAATHPDEDWLCPPAGNLLYKHITTPFFVRMDLSDSVGIASFLAFGGTQLDYQRANRQSLLDLATLPDSAADGAGIIRVPGAYGPNCGQHVGMEVDPWFLEATVAGPDGPRTFHEALVEWLGGANVSPVDDETRSASACSDFDEER